MKIKPFIAFILAFSFILNAIASENIEPTDKKISTDGIDVEIFKLIIKKQLLLEQNDSMKK